MNGKYVDFSVIMLIKCIVFLDKLFLDCLDCILGLKNLNFNISGNYHISNLILFYTLFITSILDNPYYNYVTL